MILHGKPRFALLLLLGACSSRKPVTGDSLEAGNSKKAPPSRTAVPELRSEKMEPLMFGKEGYPKMRKASRDDGTVDRVETDFNGDGRVDMIQYFDPTGNWVSKESADLDGNGKMEILSYYKKTVGNPRGEVVLQEIDTQASGKPDLWKHFKNGKLTKRELDRKGRGVPDYWEYYDEQSGRLARIEKDENGDGLADSQPVFKQVIKPEGTEPGKP